MKLTYDIQEIEKVLSAFVLQSEATQNVFEGQRPSVDDDEDGLSDFAVVSVASGITDKATHGTCMSRIEIFAKNRRNGTKNGTKLSYMYKKLCAAFPIIHDTYLFDIYPSIIQLGNDKNGYFVQAININTKIKTIQ